MLKITMFDKRKPMLLSFRSERRTKTSGESDHSIYRFMYPYI
ncbi:MAG: hypothetical protein BWY28_03206 [bacterium ADurb.Bin236]|nr:MAG: hypothetical protein BWY28_03206 [bacterium ADurb.Bin236]